MPNRTNFALYIIYGSFILGFFFNSANIQFFPAGTPVPKNAGCDLLSDIARVCIPSIAVNIYGGTLTFNFDIIVLVLTFGGLFVGTYILEKNSKRFAYS